MKKEKAFLLAMCSSFFYGVQTVMISLDLRLGNTPNVSLAGRGLMGIVILYVMIRMKGKSVLMPRDKIIPMALLSLLGGASTNLFLTLAYDHLPVGLVTTLHYLYPFAIILVNLLLFRKKIHPMAVAACAISLVGVAIMADYSGGVSLQGILLALASVCSWSFYVIYYEHSGLSGVADEAIVFYNCVCQLLLGGCSMAVTGEFTRVTGSAPLHLILVLLGIGLGIVAQMLLQSAISNIGSGLAGILGILEPVSSLLLGVLILQDVLTGRQKIAAVVTLAGIALVLYSEKISQSREKGNS